MLRIEPHKLQQRPVALLYDDRVDCEAVNAMSPSLCVLCYKFSEADPQCFVNLRVVLVDTFHLLPTLEHQASLPRMSAPASSDASFEKPCVAFLL